MLVPYFEFKLTRAPDQPIPLEQLFLGPTPNIGLSMNSLALYLAKRGSGQDRGSAIAESLTGSGRRDGRSSSPVGFDRADRVIGERVVGPF